jgi:DNA-binding response OmpR family regulator
MNSWNAWTDQEFLREEQAYTYLILLSSRKSKQDIVQGLESGADDYLTKSF